MSEDPPLSVRIAARVRGIAAEKNITQTALAAELGMAQSAISQRMRGAKPWSLDELATVCRVLDVEFALVIDDHQLASVA